MMNNRRRLHQSGMTLVELLVAMAVFGIISAAIFNVYLSMQRTTTVQEEVVDIEQNLRIALDSILDDIRLAGYLVPQGDAPFSSAAANSLTLRTFTPPSSTARIATDITLANTPGTAQAVSVENPHPLVANNYVRVIRPSLRILPISRILKVESITAGTVNLLEVNKSVDLFRGDMLTRYFDPNTDGDDDPNTLSVGTTITDSATISYSLSGDQLIRDPGTSAVVAEKISSLGFRYFLENGTNTTAPLASDLDDIIGVEVTLSGQATTQQGTKNRTIQSSVLLRNQ